MPRSKGMVIGEIRPCLNATPASTSRWLVGNREGACFRCRYTRKLAQNAATAKLKGAATECLGFYGKHRTPERTSIDPIRIKLEHLVI